MLETGGTVACAIIDALLGERRPAATAQASKKSVHINAKRGKEDVYISGNM